MIPALFLVIAAVAYRVTMGLAIHSGATWLSNFTPLAALALCSAAYFPTKYKFSVPLIALLVSDCVLNFYYSAAIISPLVLCRYIALALVCCVGFWLRNRASLRTLLPASVFASTIFYAITNTCAWFADPGYTKNLAGLVQALTVGLPQFSTTPSWMFFRNSLLSDLLFTLLFVACMSFGRNAAQSSANLAVPRAT